MDGRRGLAGTTLEIDDGNHLQGITIPAARQIGCAIAPGAGHYMPDLVNFGGRIEPAPAQIGLNLGKIAFLMAGAQVGHADACQFGYLGRVELAQDLATVGLKAVAHMYVQRL